MCFRLCTNLIYIQDSEEIRSSIVFLHDFQTRDSEKYGHESRGTWNQECAGEDQQQFSRQIRLGLLKVKGLNLISRSDFCSIF
jgi:hypothetical protein